MLLVCNRHMRDIHPAVEETENLDQLLFVGHLIDQHVVSDYRVANRVIIDQIAGTVRKSIWAGADAGNLLYRRDEIPECRFLFSSFHDYEKFVLLCYWSVIGIFPIVDIVSGPSSSSPESAWAFPASIFSRISSRFFQYLASPELE